MKPIIGVITRPDHLESGNKVDVIYSYIRAAIVEFGGIPLSITIPTMTIYDGKKLEDISSFTIETMNDLLPILKLCNGFVFQGGDSFYDYDLKILDYAYQNDIPSLGICLGMQLMSCYKNGEMGTINNHYSKENYVHSIFIKENSKLKNILKVNECKVNSRHHDYIVKTDLDIVAYSFDHIIEAVEDRNKTFFIGVQWHPEDMITYDTVMKELWKSFLVTCRECVYGNQKIDQKEQGSSAEC